MTDFILSLNLPINLNQILPLIVESLTLSILSLLLMVMKLIKGEQESLLLPLILICHLMHLYTHLRFLSPSSFGKVSRMPNTILTSSIIGLLGMSITSDAFLDILPLLVYISLLTLYLDLIVWVAGYESDIIPIILIMGLALPIFRLLGVQDALIAGIIALCIGSVSISLQLIQPQYLSLHHMGML